MENTFIWKLTPEFEIFFARDYRNYHAHLTPEEISSIRNCFIKGNTFAVREILKFINNGNYVLKITNSNNDPYYMSISYDGRSIISSNDLEGIYLVSVFQPELEDIKDFLLHHVLDWYNTSLNVIQSIDKIEGDQTVNLYTKSENCIVPTETWKKAINKVKKNNRSIKNYEKIAFQSFYPVRNFNRNIAKSIAEKTVNQFGKSSKLCLERRNGRAIAFKSSKLCLIDAEIKYLQS
jgi:hypothetical protein